MRTSRVGLKDDETRTGGLERPRISAVAVAAVRSVAAVPGRAAAVPEAEGAG